MWNFIIFKKAYDFFLNTHLLLLYKNGEDDCKEFELSLLGK